MVAGKREGSVADSLHCRKVWLHFCWGASQVPANTVSPAQKRESALRLYLASTTTAMSIVLFYAHIAEHKTLAKKPPKRYKQLWQWKSDSKWQSVSILSNIHCGRWLVKCIRPQRKAAQVTEVIHPLCSERQHPALFWVSSREKKLPVMIPAAIPLQTILRLFIFFPQFFFCLCPSHDCLSLLLHHGWGFLVLAGWRGSWMLRVWNLELLCRWRYRVFRDGTVLHVPGEVAVTIDGYRSKSGGEMEGQRASGGDVGDAGVWHHRSVAVSVTAAPSFPFKVQGQGPPAPGLFDLGLHLDRKVWVFNF